VGGRRRGAGDSRWSPCPWACAAVAAAACGAHSHVDDPRGDGGVLQPCREGVPQGMRAPQVQVAQVGPGRVHGGLVDPPQVVGPSRRRNAYRRRAGATTTTHAVVLATTNGLFISAELERRLRSARRDYRQTNQALRPIQGSQNTAGSRPSKLHAPTSQAPMMLPSHATAWKGRPSMSKSMRIMRRTIGSLAALGSSTAAPSGRRWGHRPRDVPVCFRSGDPLRGTLTSLAP
jgi:hypothetical protein